MANFANTAAGRIASEEWAKGEMMSMDEAVAYSLDEETG